MREILSNISNFIAAAFAFIAAITWISSGILGEVSLVAVDTNVVSSAQTNSAKLNTTAAWCAMFSSLFVMASSMIAMWPKLTKNTTSDEWIDQAINDAKKDNTEVYPEQKSGGKKSRVKIFVGLSVLIASFFIVKSDKS